MGTFFNSVGEIGLALHEMYEISGMPMGEILYEEYMFQLEKSCIYWVLEMH